MKLLVQSSLRESHIDRELTNERRDALLTLLRVGNGRIDLAG